MARSMAALYPLVLFLHGLNRWLVLVGGIWLVCAAATSTAHRGASAEAPVRAPWKVYVGALHLQFLLGLLLLFISPLAQSAWGDLAGTMRVRPVRFFIVEHTTMMVVALAVAQWGSVKSRTAIDAGRSARTSLVSALVSLLLILAAIPWPFLDEIARPWLRRW